LVGYIGIWNLCGSGILIYVSSKFEFGSAFFSAGVGGAPVGLFDVRGKVYVPTFPAPLLSDNWFGFVLAMLVSFPWRLPSH